jgi:hypothetical protein
MTGNSGSPEIVEQKKREEKMTRWIRLVLVALKAWEESSGFWLTVLRAQCSIGA